MDEQIIFCVWRVLMGMAQFHSICAGCCRERGERTREAYDKIVKPDYSKLFSIGFWMDGLLQEGKKL